MEKTTVRAHIERCALATMIATLAFGQNTATVGYRHLLTYGSRAGIHPPKVLNRRAANFTLGQAEHPYGLVFPVAVTTDLRGRVWITDSGTSSVHIFDSVSGDYREIRRVGNSAFAQPSGIATDQAGRIYVADSTAGNVFVFDENGEYDRALIPARTQRLLEGPTAVAIADDGKTIYVADPPRNIVIALDREGEIVATIPLPAEMSGASAIHIVNNQICLLGSMQHRVGMFSPAGKPRGELHWDGIRYPEAFAWDARQQRFFVANPRMTAVEVVTEDGQGVGAFGQSGSDVDQMRRVDSLYVDAKGRVYVVDSHEGKVLVFAPN